MQCSLKNKICLETRSEIESIGRSILWSILTSACGFVQRNTQIPGRLLFLQMGWFLLFQLAPSRPLSWLRSLAAGPAPAGRLREGRCSKGASGWSKRGVGDWAMAKRKAAPSPRRVCGGGRAGGIATRHSNGIPDAGAINSFLRPRICRLHCSCSRCIYARTGDWEFAV